jgi:uncharacterized protein (TIGR03083 family)
VPCLTYTVYVNVHLMDADLRARTAAFEQTVRSTLDLTADFEPADWTRPTECPGWSVKDQLSHIVGVERFLLGDVIPEPVDAPHVRNDFGRLMESGVAARRDMSGPAVREELAETLERRLAQLAEIDPDQEMLCPDGKLGDYRRFMLFRPFDCYVHEQDIRRAVGRPGNLDAPAAELAWRILGTGLPFVVAYMARAEPGQSVAFHISGPPAHRAAVLVGPDGRGKVAEPAPDDPTVTLGLDWESYLRLAAGRCGPDAVSVDIAGDPDLAARVLSNMAVTP